jgi:hypothetical protein
LEISLPRLTSLHQSLVKEEIAWLTFAVSLSSNLLQIGEKKNEIGERDN